MTQRPPCRRPLLITCCRATLTEPVPKPAYKTNLEAKVLPARVLEADVVQLDEGRLQLRGLGELEEDGVVTPAPGGVCCSIAVVCCGGTLLLLLLLSILGALRHLQNHSCRDVRGSTAACMCSIGAVAAALDCTADCLSKPHRPRGSQAGRQSQGVQTVWPAVCRSCSALQPMQLLSVLPDSGVEQGNTGMHPPCPAWPCCRSSWPPSSASHTYLQPCSPAGRVGEKALGNHMSLNCLLLLNTMKWPPAVCSCSSLYIMLCLSRPCHASAAVPPPPPLTLQMQQAAGRPRTASHVRLLLAIRSRSMQHLCP